jgi:hypothetical protein
MATSKILVSSFVGIGDAAFEGPIEEVARTEAREAEDLLKDLGIPVHYFCLHASFLLC